MKMEQTKEDVLQEILKGISDTKQLGGSSVSLDDINPWEFSDSTIYLTKELHKLGYKLHVYHYTDGTKPTGEPSGLKVSW